MSKDPAFLLYPQDFLVGTMTMSNEQVGKYVRLLCLQHQTGHLTEDDMLDICEAKDVKIWRKFKQDSEGLYYNERLELETEKRKKYTDSRRKNLQSKKPHMKPHMEPHMENVNEDIIVSKDRKEKKRPDFPEFKEYALEKKPNIDIPALKLKYESWIENKWRDGNNKEIINWKSKLLNTLPYIKEKEVGGGTNQAPQYKPTPTTGKEINYTEYKANKK